MENILLHHSLIITKTETHASRFTACKQTKMSATGVRVSDPNSTGEREKTKASGVFQMVFMSFIQMIYLSIHSIVAVLDVLTEPVPKGFTIE